VAVLRLTRIVFARAQELHQMLDELEASRSSRERARKTSRVALGPAGFRRDEVAATGEEDADLEI
jgi:hypothetical protein